MTTADPLADLLRADGARRGQTVSRLGYFCAPFRPESGPYADRVIKVYRALSDHAALERLAAAHDAYVAALTATGVPLPETEFRLVRTGAVLRPVIVQEALPAETMMRPKLRDVPREEALALLESAGAVIARFWNAADRFDTRIGFHPSIRNFAVRDGEAVFFDTFPPLIHYSREEMGRLLLQFSESRLMRWAGPLVQRRITAIQDEWYSPAETLVGLVGSACRLRPADAEAILDWGRRFAPRAMPRWADEIAEGLARPPRLPGEWTAVRRLLGLEGEPNV
ncbi:DUF6206 family protein [Rhodosalinus sp. K401]|uniref:DUF6206 family protein n=1 Tax=Rhodosalinus sp. K401 TaxID=3239195 RepID=UPI003525E8F7